MQSKFNYKNQFFKNGFFKINDLFLKSDLKNLEKNLYDFANQFAKKINHKFFRNQNINNFNKFNKFCINLEKYNKEYFLTLLLLLQIFSRLKK